MLTSYIIKMMRKLIINLSFAPPCNIGLISTHLSWLIVKHFVFLFFICMSFLLVSAQDSLAVTEGKRLSATASAQYSAVGYGPHLAVDNNEATLWVASITPNLPSNNKVWFQLDLGKVIQVAKLHWFAASGSPYPASFPNRYQIIISNDGVKWTTVYVTNSTSGNVVNGDVPLNTDARYVRLVTTKVNDGTGWSLGLREIWLTEGRDTRAQWHTQAAMSDGHIKITWQPQHDPQIKKLLVYRSETPTDRQGTVVARLGVWTNEYTDSVPNWTPYYYWVQSIDKNGVALDQSPKMAAFGHPSESISDRIESFAFWYETYKPTTDPDASIRHIGNATFVVGAGRNAVANLAKLGIGALSYITLYQSSQVGKTFSTDSDTKTVAKQLAPIAFYNNKLQFPNSPAGYVPSVFCRPGNDEYNPKSIQYVTCPNSETFREIVLDQVRKLIAGGDFGFFVDNGYEDNIVATSVCTAPGHSHYYGDNLTSADAFIGMLMEITCAVKRQNPRGIVMVNGGVPSQSNYYGIKIGDVSDGRLWESYLRSSAITPKEHVSSWDSVYRKSLELEKAWLLSPPQRTFVLTYPWDREEAFFCYATAKLFNLPWSANLGISDLKHSVFGGHFGTYPVLVNLRLGTPVETRRYGGEKLGEIYVRRYERGFVAVNPTKVVQRLVVPSSFTHKFLDIYSGLLVSGESITLTLPPESGRVYVY